jgi:hypothetical protein
MDQNLIPAVLTYIRQKGGFATKTKLLKLLYLLDLEAYRETHQTLTGFTWVFYLYGPWAPEYDTTLDTLSADGRIELRPGSRPDLETVFVNSLEEIPLTLAFPGVRQELKAKRIIEAWANRPTGEVLDYVYFHTSPMRNAQRDEPLDFSSLLGEPSPLDSAPRRSKIDEKLLADKRRSLASALKAVKQQAIQALDPPPKYDEQFFEALDALEKD